MAIPEGNQNIQQVIQLHAPISIHIALNLPNRSQAQSCEESVRFIRCLLNCDRYTKIHLTKFQKV